MHCFKEYDCEIARAGENEVNEGNALDEVD